MANQSNEGFTDNWAYLKTELGWLDRMLMMALSRYRQDKKEVERVAQSKADKVSSHWWKGVISLDSKIAYDEHRPNTKISNSTPTSTSKQSSKSTQSAKVTVSTVKQGYQQQLESRLKISQRNGVVLALPWLRDRLNLSLFEKNLVIMALAPEVNRRYARLYRYLQSHDDNPVTDLPTVELVLRLLCRNDAEWRKARTAFHPDAPLIRHGLLMTLNDSHDPFLNATLRLSDDCVDSLLAESPDPILMEQILATPPLVNRQQWALSGQFPVEFSPDISISPEMIESPKGIDPETASLADIQSNTETDNETLADSSATLAERERLGSSSSGEDHGSLPVQQATWDDLIIEPTLKTSLRHLSHRLTFHDTVKQKWDLSQAAIKSVPPGLVTLFAGLPGTGKTLAAKVLARALTSSVHCIDLAGIMDIDYFQVLDEIESSPPTILLIQSAEQWLSREASLPPSRLTHFLSHRHQQPGLTIFSVDHEESVAQTWHQHIDQTLAFSAPVSDERLILWQKAFPPKLKFSLKIDWPVLSQIELNGHDIEAIAHDAMVRMVADGSARLKMEHLVAALQWQKVPAQIVETFVDDCKIARKQALAAQAAKCKPSTAKAAKAKSAKAKSTTQKSSSKRTRKVKPRKSGTEDATLLNPLISEATDLSSTPNKAVVKPLEKADTTVLVDSSVQTPTS